MLAEHFDKLLPFVSKMEELNYGDSTRQKMSAMLSDTPTRDRLQLQLAAMLDTRLLVSTTYELEGDGLELLLVYERVQRLREVGRQIKARSSGVLPNVDAALRQLIEPANGTVVEKVFEGLGMCIGKIVSSRMVNSDLYPGQMRKGYKVLWQVDKTHQEFEIEEIRSMLQVKTMPQREEVATSLEVACYLEGRLTGTCYQPTSYSCEHMYAVCKAARAFDPMYACECLCEDMVDTLVASIRPLMHHTHLGKLKEELPHYLAATREVSIDRSDVKVFTEQVLHFWKSTPSQLMSEWRKAARIVFAISPNSAACERVFALLQNMYGEQRVHVLADHLQSSLMMRFNEREV